MAMVLSLQALQTNAGGMVEVCVFDLPRRDEDGPVLLDEVGVADPSEMASRLLAADTGVLCF